MQNRKILRVLLCVMVLALCFSIFPNSAAAKESDKIAPVFDLYIETEDGTKEYTAFCVKDPVTECVYLISAAEAGEAALDADITLAGVGYNEQAAYLKTVGLISYFWAPDLNEVASYILDGPMVKTVQISVVSRNAEGVREVVTTDPQSLSGWADCGHYWLGGHVEESTEQVGAPVLKDEVGLLVGMLTRTEDNIQAILALDGTLFPMDCAVVDAHGNVYRHEDGSSAAGGGVRTGVTIGAVLAVFAVIVVLVAFNKKPGKDGQKKAVTGATSAQVREATAPMNMNKSNEMASNLVNFPHTAPARGAAGWQLRCVRGPMEGKAFPLHGRLTLGRAAGNDILFPDGTKGVSGRHCQVSLSGDRVVLQDLNATYGTFYGAQKAKLQPNMEYPLRAGDMFYLAEGGPAFRLEKMGAVQANFSVRNGSGMVYRPNDDGEITFGRAADCVVAFDGSNGAVSGRHCKVFMKDNAVHVMDLGSTNGTFFGENQRLKPNTSYKVSNGTKFYLVDERNTFVIVQE